MQPRLQSCFLLPFVCLFPGFVQAQAPLHERIDALIAAGKLDFAKQAAADAAAAGVLSRVFLGMNLTCCQCHDHPLIDAYKQDHYYGLFAFLSRSFLYTDKKTKTSVMAEKGEGEVSFQSVFMAKVTKNTGPRLPDGPLV